MSNPGLKVSGSNLSRAGGRANDSGTLARLQALDKNGDGQLDLDEVCDAIDEIVRKEKTERTLKWMLGALAIFSLLTIAATVGLTYAVVALSKDTQVDGSVLQSKDTGEALRTGSFLQSQNATALAASVAASNDPAAVLGRVSSIKVPSLNDGEAYTVHKVDAVTMLLNGSVLVRTATGLDVLMPVDNLIGSSNEATPANTTAQGGRKLLQTGGYTITLRQSTIAGMGRTYGPFAVTGATTIDILIAKFNDQNEVGNLAPAASVVNLKSSCTDTAFLAVGATLSSLNSPTELCIDSRDVGYANYCTGDYCTPSFQTIYVPPGDTVAGIKREIAYDKKRLGISWPVEQQKLYKKGTSRTNPYTELGDNINIFTGTNAYCAGDCIVYVQFNPAAPTVLT